MPGELPHRLRRVREECGFGVQQPLVPIEGTPATGRSRRALTAPGRSRALSGVSYTPVTGTELTKVKAAVKAKDSAVTVTEVRKDPDGSYDVFGTKSGSPVTLEVSKDLKTITTGPGRVGHGGGPQPAPSSSSSSTSTT